MEEFKKEKIDVRNFSNNIDYTDEFEKKEEQAQDNEYRALREDFAILKKEYENKIKEIDEKNRRLDNKLEKEVNLARIDQLLIITFYTAVVIAIFTFFGFGYSILKIYYSNNEVDSFKLIIILLLSFVSVIYCIFTFIYGVHNVLKIKGDNYGKDCIYYIKNVDNKDICDREHCKYVKLLVKNARFFKKRSSFIGKFKYARYQNCFKCYSHKIHTNFCHYFLKPIFLLVVSIIVVYFILMKL